MEVDQFPMSIRSKVNGIARLAFELTYSDVAVQQVSYYTTKNPSPPRILPLRRNDNEVVSSHFPELQPCSVIQ